VAAAPDRRARRQLACADRGRLGYQHSVSGTDTFDAPSRQASGGRRLGHHIPRVRERRHAAAERRRQVLPALTAVGRQTACASATREQRPAGAVQCDDEPACAGWLLAALSGHRGEIQRPGDRFDTHAAPPRCNVAAVRCPVTILGSRFPPSGLSFGLIHCRPEPFMSGRRICIRARHERFWPSVNNARHCWKACWGQPLKSSNLLSSATLICANTVCDTCTACASRLLSLMSQSPLPGLEGAA
jgi:hypothetical protein